MGRMLLDKVPRALASANPVKTRADLNRRLEDDNNRAVVKVRLAPPVYI
jgi:hypothetical protein